MTQLEWPTTWWIAWLASLRGVYGCKCVTWPALEMNDEGWDELGKFLLLFLVLVFLAALLRTNLFL